MCVLSMTEQRYLEFLQMESRVDDPPVLSPFFTLVATQTVVQHILKSAKRELLKMAELVGHNLSHKFRLCDGHSRHRPKPSDRHFTCQTDFANYGEAC